MKPLPTAGLEAGHLASGYQNLDVSNKIEAVNGTWQPASQRDWLAGSPRRVSTAAVGSATALPAGLCPVVLGGTMGWMNADYARARCWPAAGGR